MRAGRRLSIAVVGAVAAAGVLAGCGEAGSSGTEAPQQSASGEGCAPVAGEQLIALTDDKALQNADNIIPAINTKVATPQLVAALDKVSAVLDTPKLVQLNKAVDVDRKSAQAAAQEFSAANGLADGVEKGPGGKITVGAGNFTESEIIAELYKIQLTAAGYQVTVQQIGNRELYEPALEKGEIQVVPEYAATMAEFLKGKTGGGSDPVSSPDVEKTVTALRGLGEQVGLSFGQPAPAQNQNAFAVTKEFAEKYGVRTLSELAAKCSGTATVLGGPPECQERPFCKPGLEQTYGLSVGSFSSLDQGGPLTKTGLRNGTISVGLVFSTDAAYATS
ncbi:glycine betaine ABC transporter substrate-binding protein [Micromonospora gifhornensis]|uniref:glycine betaine ABC transporter substrate-binding protein n=1 Tax=Micromonospora gifhornensis TaxID=84594 RepID=UPI000F879D0F|nr:glycine betaine ABC transporter substrate-binding protein [Verrucosispora sp. FIM060022]RUL93946.1 glycine/betaine ABC transporter substrate-binding protein [Verrucosispora sp. FIM060022]